MNPDGDTHVCSIYNPWITLYYMILSAERSEGEARVRELRAIVLPRAAELINATTLKIADYRMSDGAFAYLGTEVTPANLSQSALVGCATAPESDVNANSLAQGSRTMTFTAIGIPNMPLFGEKDAERFFELAGEEK